MKNNKPTKAENIIRICEIQNEIVENLLDKDKGANRDDKQIKAPKFKKNQNDIKEETENISNV